MEFKIKIFYLRKINSDINDAIYYHREILCYSLEYRNVDLITISSHHNITAEREPRIQKLFPDENTPRAFKFQDKKVSRENRCTYE